MQFDSENRIVGVHRCSVDAETPAMDLNVAVAHKAAAKTVVPMASTASTEKVRKECGTQHPSNLFATHP